MNKKTIRNIPKLRGKGVFLTVDFNISLSDGKISNDTRIVESLPTIKYLYEKGAKVILCSHLGRPKGYDKKYSLKPVARRIESLFGKKVHLIDKFREIDELEMIRKIDNKDVVLLENIRFYEEEKQNDWAFSKHLACMADYFVNDAFGASHRVHASTVGISEFIPSYAGFLMEKEIKMLSKALQNPKKPLVVIIGGAKTPEKISVIEKLLDIADTILLGGAIANTFLAAWGFGMGESKVDYEMIEMSKVVFWNTTRKHSALVLPLDVVSLKKGKNEKLQIYNYKEVPHNVCIYDIGPKTKTYYQEIINQAKTIIWNGPMGLYEDKKFKGGTDHILKCLAQSSAFTIIGGGDTISNIKSKKYIDQIDHISTGGSAMLEYIKKGTLPGIDVLLNV